MSLNYENYVESWFNTNTDLHFKVEPERMFLQENVKADTIYITTKYLASDIEYDFIKIQPINMIILGLPTGQKVEELQEIVNQFVKENNYKQDTFGNAQVKQEYSTPVVLDGLMEVGNAKRPVLMLSGYLTIVEGVIDVSELKVDNGSIKPLSFNWNYVMTPNTQPNSTEKIASSKKSSAAFSCVLAIPPVDTYSTFLNKCSNIANGTNSGNSDFTISFKVGTISFSYTCKLTNMQFTTQPNAVPTCILTFMR